MPSHGTPAAGARSSGGHHSAASTRPRRGFVAGFGIVVVALVTISASADAYFTSSSRAGIPVAVATPATKSAAQSAAVDSRNATTHPEGYVIDTGRNTTR
jgi:hypothetical protein